jgi:hypothetical protein
MYCRSSSGELFKFHELSQTFYPPFANLSFLLVVSTFRTLGARVRFHKFSVTKVSSDLSKIVNRQRLVTQHLSTFSGSLREAS